MICLHPCTRRPVCAEAMIVARRPIMNSGVVEEEQEPFEQKHFAPGDPARPAVFFTANGVTAASASGPPAAPPRGILPGNADPGLPASPLVQGSTAKNTAAIGSNGSCPRSSRSRSAAGIRVRVYYSVNVTSGRTSNAIVPLGFLQGLYQGYYVGSILRGPR